MLPNTIKDEDQLDELLSTPRPEVVETLAQVEGDILILGAGGKMGPSLARMALRASQTARTGRRVIAVSRFGDGKLRERFESWGVETIAGDLLDSSFLKSLPSAPNIVFMAGMKFGSTGNEPLTWAMNVHLPALVAERFAGSRIAAFSTGNVYGLVPIDSGGSVESDAPNPVGEYAMSCLGRERMFQYFCQRDRTPTTLIRLNYATELRYGVLVDIAKRVWNGEPVDLAMGHVNVIWQGDACAHSLCALADTSVPAAIVNVAGTETLRVRDVVVKFGELFGKPITFRNEEAASALLSNSAVAVKRYGPPRVSVGTMIRWVADWTSRGGPSLGKPTHFDSRDGRF